MEVVSTILVPTKVRLIAEVWGYIVNILENIDHVYNGWYHTVQQLVLMYHTTSFLLLETVSTHSLFSVVLNNTVSQYVAESFDAHTHTIFLVVYALKQQSRHEAGQLSKQFVCLLGRFKQDLAWGHHTSWNLQVQSTDIPYDLHWRLWKVFVRICWPFLIMINKNY